MTALEKKAALGILFIISAAFVTLNMTDEYYQIGSAKGTLIFVALWLVVPAIVLLIGIVAKKPRFFVASLLLSLYFTWQFTHYAFNGTTAGKMGAEHVHIILVPFPLAFVAVFTLAAVSIWPVLRRGPVLFGKRPVAEGDAAQEQEDAIPRQTPVSRVRRSLHAAVGIALTIFLIVMAVLVRNSFLDQKDLAAAMNAEDWDEAGTVELLNRFRSTP